MERNLEPSWNPSDHGLIHAPGNEIENLGTYLTVTKPE